MPRGPPSKRQPPLRRPNFKNFATRRHQQRHHHHPTTAHARTHWYRFEYTNTTISDTHPADTRRLTLPTLPSAIMEPDRVGLIDFMWPLAWIGLILLRVTPPEERTTVLFVFATSCGLFVLTFTSYTLQRITTLLYVKALLLSWFLDLTASLLDFLLDADKLETVAFWISSLLSALCCLHLTFCAWPWLPPFGLATGIWFCGSPSRRRCLRWCAMSSLVF